MLEDSGLMRRRCCANADVKALVQAPKRVVERLKRARAHTHTCGFSCLTLPHGLHIALLDPVEHTMRPCRMLSEPHQSCIAMVIGSGSARKGL
jgi:hypothetical protein